MKSVAIAVASLAFASTTTDIGADAFFVTPGGLAVASGTSHLAFTTTHNALSRAGGHSTACTCSICAPALHSSSCMCPSCTSVSVSRRSHGGGCRCGACSVGIHAHVDGCDCGDCASVVGGSGLHGVSCKCSMCIAGAAGAHLQACSCATCAGGKTRRSSTVMGMGSGGGEAVTMATDGLRERLLSKPESVKFEETMQVIADAFDYTPKRFVNGETSSEASVNEGSCKIFSFGKLAGLSPAETLACFGEHYRGVIADPSGDSHGNIRAFMLAGWEGVEFPDRVALSPK